MEVADHAIRDWEKAMPKKVEQAACRYCPYQACYGAKEAGEANSASEDSSFTLLHWSRTVEYLDYHKNENVLLSFLARAIVDLSHAKRNYPGSHFGEL
jgi:hypothetical protein